MNSSDRCQFCRSDKREVAGIEKQHHPFSLVVFQVDRDDFFGGIIIGFRLEGRSRVIRLSAKWQFTGIEVIYGQIHKFTSFHGVFYIIFNVLLIHEQSRKGGC